MRERYFVSNNYIIHFGFSCFPFDNNCRKETMIKTAAIPVHKDLSSLLIILNKVFMDFIHSNFIGFCIVLKFSNLYFILCSLFLINKIK